MSEFKEIINCKNCGKEFENWKSRKRKFCSNDCYRTYEKPKRTLESREKIRNITKQYYQQTSKEDLRKRWDKIGRKVHLDEDEITRLEAILNLGYIKDKKLLFKVAEINSKSYKALNNYINENPDW